MLVQNCIMNKTDTCCIDNWTKKIQLSNKWKKELQYLILHMQDLGDKPDLLRYELLATEALRLSRCISDLTEITLEN